MSETRVKSKRIICLHEMGPQGRPLSRRLGNRALAVPSAVAAVLGYEAAVPRWL